MKKISIIGLGYIGLPTAILAAECGYDVSGYDINETHVTNINLGEISIVEPEIKERLAKALKNKSFRVSTSLNYSDCFVIAVPTPIKNNKSPDISHVMDAAKTIASRLMPGNLIILESTVPVGTTEAMTELLEDLSGLKSDIDFFTSHCPERVLPGKIFKEVVENDRIIGSSSQKACDLSRLFYAKFVKGFLHITDDRTAEMVKLIENSSRDVQLAFANQVNMMCEKAGIDTYKAIELANRHPRVEILSPTCGVGGHCVAVDPYFLINKFPEETTLLKAARTINDAKPHHVLNKVFAKVQEFTKKKPKVFALGLTFKPNVDDIRESPALFIAEELAAKKELLSFVAYDSHINKNIFANLNIESANSIKEGIEEADIILILVKHKEFTLLNEEIFNKKIVIDTCGLLYDFQKTHAKELLKGAIKTVHSFENVSI